MAAAVITAGLTLPASAAGTEDASARRSEHVATQAALESVVHDGPPGGIVLAELGPTAWAGRAGTANLATGRTPRADDRFRVGSITKTFVATVLLQLEEEGKLSLDDTVDHWLPGLVAGNGNDGSKIRLRQLLNHTSGIYSYTEDDTFKQREFSTDFLQHRYETWTPRRIVRLAMTHQPTFAPGHDWSYSDTNYVIASMVIQKATGHSYAHEIEQRILRPLHLVSTSVPGTRVRIPGPSGRAYSKLTGELAGPGKPGGAVYDVTELNPSFAGAAGEMISNGRDLNRFYRALFSGRLLKDRQLKEMMTTVPIENLPNFSYGLGLMKMTLSCGTEVWGHNGGIQGSISQTMATADGDHVLSLNFNGDWNVHEQRVVDAEFCGA
ncbi:class A beta-lactamase-related serine hydrolase [Streptomyces aquilus]|uniref:Class A beta-lactamase-related serine hydrolase n=1 Tax=Streptomyces aquilus TaxID=2548456 RepID=A0A3Q9C7J3_9ACTN|nr:serine hydrolase domain-containing protein [Streptomyces aquilus]AZP22703.1 class A beta-lactamase-related serine hydrolase [Streptomyces aquilus]